MKAMGKRALSLLLSLAMILSLGVLPASAEDVEIVSVEAEQEVDAVNYPAQQFSYYEPNGLSIDVKAPAGALPRGTTMEVSRLADLSRVQNAVDRAADLNGSVVLAADISFWNDGAEVEPVEGNKIRVTMTAPEIAEIDNPVVVHVPDEEPAVAERIDPVPNDDSENLQMGDQISFEAESFSVYAVMTDPDAPAPRLRIIFHDLQDNEIEIHVKEKDTKASDEEYSVILYDPGCGTIEDTALFFAGWTDKPEYDLTDKPLDIAAIRKYVKEQINWANVTEETAPLHYYPMLLRHVTITYLDERGIALGSESQHILPEDTSTEYKVNMSYIPPTNTQNFEGWKVLTADYLANIIAPDGTTYTLDTVFPNGTYITVKGDVTFTVDAPEGHWLVFDENGKGATYNAPQFVKEGQKTARPRPDADMYRRGYVFGGWYSDAACTTAFTFGGELTENTTVYAKWTECTTANYTVVFWTQNADCSGYDVKASAVVENAPVGSVIPYTFRDNGAEDYVTFNGTNYHYTGFTLVEGDIGQQVRVTADGDAVLNLHFDRIVYNLKFYLYREQAGTNSNNRFTCANNSGGGNNVWGIATWHTATTEANMPTTTYEGGIHRDQDAIDGYYGYYIVLSAYYGENIADRWPKYTEIIGPSATQQPVSFIMMVGTKLKPNPSSGGDGTIKGEVSIMDENILGATNDVNGNFMIIRFPNSFNDWMYHIYFEIPQGKTAADYSDTKVFNGKTYYKERDVVSRSSNQDPAQQNPPQYQGFAVVRDGSRPLYYSYGAGSCELDYYYDRLEYLVTYYDGIYVDGEGKTLLSRGGQHLHESSLITYGSPIPDEYKNYVPDQPAEPGYVFEGWYVDSGCTTPYTFTTMPLGGITVFAKWRQIQYRVFLRPHAVLDNGTNDETLDWGSDKQAMNFRISYGTKISAPTGIRTGYEMVGWYTDAEYTHAFDASLVALTESAVTEEYDKTLPENYTDPMDKWGDVGEGGYNSDIQDENGNPRDRFWINNKLELHARWRKVIEGAPGIRVIYDLNGGSGDISDSFYYKDTAKAVVQGAAIAPENYRFLYWVVQSWDKTEEEFVDTDLHVFPGNTFEVNIDNAWMTNVVMEQKTDDQGNPVWEIGENGEQVPVMVIKSADYFIQLRAEYGQEEAPDKTYIRFWANNETEASETHTHLLINQAIDIPTTTTFQNAQIDHSEDESGAKAGPTGLSYAGHVFLGWAKLNMVDGQPDPNGPQPDELTAEDLFLRWVADESEAAGGHYTAQNKDGDWITVTQVAADEFDPYQDLYAVWSTAFYVYHSGTNQVERIILSGSVTGFDLTKLVDTTNFLYGGYYAAYPGASEAFAADAESLSWTEVASISGYNDVAQINSFATQGFVSKATDTNGTAYDGTNATWSNPITVAGNAITPESGAVYYIKEVPAAKYLQPKMKFTYIASTGQIGTSWLFTNTDDTNYGDVGFMVSGSKVVGDKVTSVTITALNTGTTETYTASGMFPGSAQMSYKMVYNDMSTYPSAYDGDATDCNTLTDGASVHMFWVTPDGMLVTSTAVRTYTNITMASGYTNGIKAAKSTQTSTISVYQA